MAIAEGTSYRFDAIDPDAVIRRKDKDVIAKKLCQIWIATFGSPHNFLSDNGGEFSNKSTKITVKILILPQLQRLAESPGSIGTCERHNSVLTKQSLKLW